MRTRSWRDPIKAPGGCVGHGTWRSGQDPGGARTLLRVSEERTSGAMWVMVPYVRVSRRDTTLMSRASPKSATFALKRCGAPGALCSSTLPARARGA